MIFFGKSCKGYDIFYVDPGTCDKMNCKVCGSDMVGKRSNGPTGMAEAMAQKGHSHDRFVCPHSGKDWHVEVLRT